MATPENCRECEYTQLCRSYYGGSLCMYKEEIYRKAVKLTDTKKEGKP